REEWIDGYREDFESWALLIDERSGHVRSWNRDEFWRWVRELNPRIPPPTKLFVDRWTTRVATAADVAELADDPACRRLIRDREAFLKKGRARLQNRRHLELWSGASGTGRLDFRWGITQDLLLDIIAGLEPDTLEPAASPTG
ncbi:MAG: DUF6361 family protein, partial [Acidobacteriota bacterium]